ncbi:multidrug effflux MFS transporter [Microbacterium kribbense]|uniref:Multidrug effflux MFS transporter n=1 Tax=Microbacterium kribbense TaxID=433645 RepID=A0ABP7GK79_9MICO
MPTAAALDRATGTRMRTVRTLVILALLTAAAPLSIDIYTPSLPLIQDELGGGTALAQASITTCLLGIAVGQLLWGPLSDRFGRRPITLIGAIGWTAASLASALAPTAGVLIAVRVATGLFGAAGIVVARSVLRDVSAKPRVTASRIGMMSVVTGIAPIVAPAGGAAIAHAWGWRADFVTLAVLGAVATVAFALFVPETLAAHERVRAGSGVLRGMARGLRDRGLVGATLAIGVFSFAFYAYIASASFIVEREFAHPPAAFALVFGTNAVAMLSATLVFRVVVRRRPASWATGVGLAVCTVSGLVLAVAAAVDAGQGVPWAASTLFAAGAGFVLPGAHSWGQATLVASGVASALTGSAQFFGGVLGSPVTGAFGVSALNLGIVIAAACALGCVVWAFGRRVQKRA